MNELSLEVAAKEAHEKAVSYFGISEQYGYKFIMEVKKIRDKGYFKTLGYGSFDQYCESTWNVKRDFMDQRIEIATSIGNEWEYADTYRRLGHSKSLILARMEPEVRRQIESKHSIDELTVKKLKEAERRIKQFEEQADKAKHESHHYKSLWEQEKRRPPQTITKTKEVIPDKIKKELEELRIQNNSLHYANKIYKEKAEKYDLQNTDEFNEEQARVQREKLQHEANINVLEVRVHIKNMLEKAAITQYHLHAISAADDITKKSLWESIDMLETFTDQIKTALQGRKLGGIVNE